MVVSKKTPIGLGVIVDTSHDFEEEDFLVNTDEETMSLPSMDTGTVMKNGKVRRRLKWRPQVFRKKKAQKSFPIPSNVSVVSGLTTNSGSKSIFSSISKKSQKSQKSQTSFHTFHSTETPIIKNNRRGPKSQYTRPNYSDTFDAKRRTIEDEGRHVSQRIESDKVMSTISEVEFDGMDTMPSGLEEGAMEPAVEQTPPPLTFFDAHGVSSIAVNTVKSRVNQYESNMKIPKPRLPPLFKRKSKKTTKSNKEDRLPPPPPPAPAPASPVAFGRVNTLLPTISTEDFEDDRRIGLNANDPVSSSMNSMYDIEPMGDMDQSGSGTKGNDSAPSTPDRSKGNPPTPTRKYHRPTDSTTTYTSEVLPNMDSQEIETKLDPIRKSRPKSSPVDLDEGGLLEAENNLRAIHDMAAEHLAHGEFEEAIEVFEEILRGQKERYGENHYRVGTALHNLAIVHLKYKDVPKAIEFCRQAVQVRKQALVPDHPDVAVSLAQLGVAHLEAEDYENALVAFREALHIRRNMLGPKHIKCSKILNNIGCALYASDNLEESRSAFEEALDIYRYKLRKTSSLIDNDDPHQDSPRRRNQARPKALLLSMASTLCNISSIELRYGQLDDAEVALEEALLVRFYCILTIY